MKTVSEVSRISGVSVRTLHLYDEKGLLHPTIKTEAGYRLYDDTALSRLQLILLFRELQLPLKDIAEIMNSDSFNVKEVLEKQKEYLLLKREHIDGLISLADSIIEKGGTRVDFSAFDTEKMDSYREEAKQRWGKTPQYREFEEKTSEGGYGDKAEGLMEIFVRFGRIKDRSPSDEQPQALVAELQKYITDNFYTCTKEILFSLGEMYVNDERFRENIDGRGGKGTAEFAQKATSEYCKQKTAE